MARSKASKESKPDKAPKSALWKVPPIGSELEELLGGLAQHSDREAAIVGHSLLEAVLEDAVRAHLVPTPDSRLFANGAPLGSFWGLFTVGHAFGVVGSGLRTELQLLNDIRNKFAHNVRDVRFAAEDVSELCRALRLPEGRVAKDDDARTLALRKVGWRPGYKLTGPDGDVRIMQSYTAEELQNPKTRFLVSVRECWFGLFMASTITAPVHWRRRAKEFEQVLREERQKASPGTPG